MQLQRTNQLPKNLLGRGAGGNLLNIINQSRQVVENHYEAFKKSDWEAWQSTLHPEVLFVSSQGVQDLPSRLHQQKSSTDHPHNLDYSIRRVVASSDVAAMVLATTSFGYADDIDLPITHSYNVSFWVVLSPSGRPLIRWQQISEIAKDRCEEALKTAFSMQYNDNRQQRARQLIDITHAMPGLSVFVGDVVSIKESKTVVNFHVTHDRSTFWIQSSRNIAHDLVIGKRVRLVGAIRFHRRQEKFYCEANYIEHI